MAANSPIHPSIASGYGLVEAPFPHVVRTFGRHQRADQSTTRVLTDKATLSEALAHLSVRTWPATRLALLDLGDWTGVLTNHRGGSDFNDHQHWAGSTTGARTIRVVDSEARWWRQGKLRERLAWEARIFDLRSPDGSTIRSIACVHDGGRWTFDVSGEVLGVEAAAPYEADRPRDRFTRQHLRDLLTAVGPGPLTEERLVAQPRFALLAELLSDRKWRADVEARAVTLEQQDDPAFRYYTTGMDWLPHIRTQAPSVIRAFERAVALNPDYEPRVRNHLDQARRIAEGSKAART